MENNSLISIENLFKNSYQIYKKAFKTFAKLIGVEYLAYLLLLYLALLVFVVIPHNALSQAMWIIFLVPCAFFGAIVGVVVRVSFILLAQSKEYHESVSSYLLKSFDFLASYAWVSLLAGLAVAGGFILFLFPGILFLVWFIFSEFALVVDGKKGTTALSYSRSLVKGHWWSVFSRLFLVLFISALVSQIPFFGSLINLFITAPFVTISLYLLYEDLKRLSVK